MMIKVRDSIFKCYSSLKDVFGVHFTLTALAGVLIGFFLTKGLDWIVELVDPESGDKFEIIQNQNEQFNEVKRNLLALQGSLSGDGREKFKEVESSLSKVLGDSKKLALAYKAISEENSNLKKMLKTEKGFSGGFDILVSNNQSFKIDNSVTLGVAGIWVNSAKLSLTSVSALDNVIPRLFNIGEGIPYTNEGGKKCVVVYMGSTSEGDSQIAKFSNQCSK